MLLSVLSASGQKPADSGYRKQRIARTDIQLLTSYYSQDGDHSAITGGIGTEWLHVYSADFTITHHPDSVQTYRLNMGVEVLTSASMDNIDYVHSSASRVFHRRYLNPSWEHAFKRSRIRAGLSTGISVEPSYLSIPAGLSVSQSNASGSREVSASLQCYFDDLRWGLLGFNFGERPVGLIYPVELRDTSWFSNYRRNSYNLDLAITQVIDLRLQIAFFPGLVLQQGLLCTPYHRVYFDDGKTERVEKLPATRWKLPLGAQLNWFATPRLILRGYYRYYTDNFGIRAHTVQIEVPVKINPQVSLSPLFRWYIQTPARYFRPYAAHDLREQYYTSDYDLSRFSSWKTGLTMRYTPHTNLSEYYLFDALTLRYMHYQRGDGLAANVISLMLDVGCVVPRK